MVTEWKVPIDARYEVTKTWFRIARGQHQTCTQRVHNFNLIVCWVYCAKVDGATSSEGFLVIGIVLLALVDTLKPGRAIRFLGSSLQRLFVCRSDEFSVCL